VPTAMSLADEHRLESSIDSPATAEFGRCLLTDGFCRVRLTSSEAVLRLASGLGKPVPMRVGRDVLQRLRPVPRHDARRRSLSALHGVGAFPFHTDGAHWIRPPHFLVMRCVDPGAGKRPTTIVDSHNIPLLPSERALLHRAIFIVDGDDNSRPFLDSILSDRWGTSSAIRFDEGCMRPAHASFGLASALLKEAMRRRPVASIEWRMDDGVVIDNWRCLHARAISRRHDGDRLLERVIVA
jgi:L-asparagine oxygenase